MDRWIDVRMLSFYFGDDFFHAVEPIEMKLKTYHQYNKMVRLLVFGTYLLTNISTLFEYFLNFFINILKIT